MTAGWGGVRLAATAGVEDDRWAEMGEFDGHQEWRITAACWLHGRGEFGCQKGRGGHKMGNGKRDESGDT